jgi:hypothetical protein
VPDATALRAQAARWLLAAAAVFAVLATVAAAGEALSTVLRLADASIARLGPAGAAVLLIGAALLSFGFVAGLLAARSPLSDGWILAIGLALVLAIRVAAIVAIDAPLPNDGRAYAELARWLREGGCCFADRPTGYPMLLAAAFSVLGDRTLTHEVLNVAFAVAGGWLLHDLAAGIGGRRAATPALFVYATLPALVLLTPLLLTDTVYATLLLAMCWTAVRIPGAPFGWAVATGVLLAASQYVRPIGPALLLPLVLAPALYVRPWRSAAMAAAIIVVTFVVAMLPAIGHNLATHGDLSLSTSSYGGWSLYMGTNQASKGRYNAADADVIDALPGANLWERSEAAGELGLERIAGDPIGFAGLTVRKFTIMWGTEEHAVIFAFRPDGRPRGTLAGVDLLAQLAYLALLAMAAAGSVLAVRAREVNPALVVAAGLVLAQLAVHTFLEVKPRYHAQAEPLLLLMAVPALAEIAAWRRRA